MEEEDKGLSDESYKNWKYTKNWRLIEQYESNGDLKSIEANGSRRQVTKWT